MIVLGIAELIGSSGALKVAGVLSWIAALAVWYMAAEKAMAEGGVKLSGAHAAEQSEQVRIDPSASPEPLSGQPQT